MLAGYLGDVTLERRPRLLVRLARRGGRRGVGGGRASPSRAVLLLGTAHVAARLLRLGAGPAGRRPREHRGGTRHAQGLRGSRGLAHARVRRARRTQSTWRGTDGRPPARAAADRVRDRVPQPRRTPARSRSGTDNPSFPPWVDQQRPDERQGLRGAVAYEIAERMGFTDDQVEWVVGAVQQVLRARARRTSTSTSTRSRSRPSATEAVDFSDGLLRRDAGAHRARRHADARRDRRRPN